MSNSDTRKWLISGRVQGVFFRESTRRQAEPLGLSGHAINLPDGRVEVIASGPASALNELERWLYDGPSAARVDTVELAEAPTTVSPGFSTG